jgi:hypothetical protein
MIVTHSLVTGGSATGLSPTEAALQGSYALAELLATTVPSFCAAACIQ